jgi:hypothetical protein
MMLPPKLRRSTMAQRRGSVKVLVQPSERLIGGDRDAGFLFASGEDLEQQLGVAAVEFPARLDRQPRRRGTTLPATCLSPDAGEEANP